MKYNENRICAYCGQKSYKYELCYDCYIKAQYEEIIQDENKNWIENPIMKDINKFYNPSKFYYKKFSIMNKIEKTFFEFIKKHLKNNYIIFPQVNLQTIITTNKNKRNDELYRNVDFCIFDAITYEPLLIIELNGKHHYLNPYWQERDKSIESICIDSNLGYLFIKNEELKLNKTLIDIIHNKLKEILEVIPF